MLRILCECKFVYILLMRLYWSVSTTMLHSWVQLYSVRHFMPVPEAGAKQRFNRSTRNTFLLLKLELVVKDGTLAVFLGCSVKWHLDCFPLPQVPLLTTLYAPINLQTLLASPTAHRISLSTTMLQLDEGDHQTRPLRLSGYCDFLIAVLWAKKKTLGINGDAHLQAVLDCNKIV